MSSASSLPYKLRPNKSVDRELFINSLVHLSNIIGIDKYCYVGLGGPFLEDFRLMHSRLGIDSLVCCETNKDTQLRQKFNSPYSCIDFQPKSIESYFESTKLISPVIIWLDVNDPRNWVKDISTFSDLSLSLPEYSVIRITLNASPESLGKTDNPNETQKYRLEKYRTVMKHLSPYSLSEGDLYTKKFGPLLLKSLDLSVKYKIRGALKRDIIWFLATHYADGQPMVTATLITIDKRNKVYNLKINNALRNWEYFSIPEVPLVLDLPVLSSHERLHLERGVHSATHLPYKIETNLKTDPYESFNKFYKLLPHFAKVEL